MAVLSHRIPKARLQWSLSNLLHQMKAVPQTGLAAFIRVDATDDMIFLS